MTPREIVLAQVHHRETPYIPYVFGYEGGVGEQLDAHYGGPQWRERLTTFIKWTGIVNTMKKEPTDQPGRERDVYGSLWRMDLRPFKLETPALAEPSFDGYQWPAPEAFYSTSEQVAEARRFCSEARKQSFLVAGLGWGLFETSWGIRGFENVLMDVATEPDFYEELLERITNQFLAYVDFVCTNLPEIDAVFFGDDWGDQRGLIVGPERWRKLFKPRYAKIYDAVHARGKMVLSHCCGSVVDIMPDLIEIGLDVLESVQPEARGMDPFELKKRWGDKIAFWGCLGSQSIIPFGKPAQIRSHIKKLCAEMGRGGGFIIAPAKALQPETTTENAVAVLEAFIEQAEAGSRA